MLPRTIRAIYRNGIIEPLEEVNLADGTEITITVLEPSPISKDGLERSFGGWKGLIDAEEFLENIYVDRRIQSRSESKL